MGYFKFFNLSERTNANASSLPPGNDDLGKLSSASRAALAGLTAAYIQKGRPLVGSLALQSSASPSTNLVPVTDVAIEVGRLSYGSDGTIGKVLAVPVATLIHNSSAAE